MFLIRLQLAEFKGQIVNLRFADEHVATISATCVLDAKSIYDVLTSRNQAQGLLEKRTAIELLAYMEDTQRSKTKTRWVHGDANLGDGLTKAGAESMLVKFMKTYTWAITDDPEARSAKKRQQARLGRFEKTESNPEPERPDDPDDFNVLLARTLKTHFPELLVIEDDEEEFPEFDISRFSTGYG